MNQLLVHGMKLSVTYGLIQKMYRRENPLMASQMSLAFLYLEESVLTHGV